METRFTAGQIAAIVGGQVEGDAETVVTSFSKIEGGKPGAISFLSNPKYTHHIYSTQSSVVLVNADLVLEHPVKATLIRVTDAYSAVAQLLQLYQSLQPRKTGIDPTASIAPSATVGEGCYVGAYAVVGDKAVVGQGSQIHAHAVIGDNVTLGTDCTVYPHVVIYHGCVVGSRVIIHAGAVIGADGFGFAPTADGYSKIPQIGNVVIKDDVEIGANTCIDRSTMGSTLIDRGVKLDNLVQIAHNVIVGANTVMSAQSGVAGSTKIGQWCMLGGQVGVAGHITVGDKTMLGAQSGVPGSLKGNQSLLGTPPMEPRAFFRSFSLFRRLPELYKRLCALEMKDENGATDSDRAL